MVVHNGKPGADGFLDCKFKAIMLGALYYFNRKLIYYGARELFGNQEHAIVAAARKSCELHWPKNIFQRWLVMLFAKVLASFSAIDNAYAQFFHDFIQEYNKLRGEHYGRAMPEVPETIQGKGVPGAAPEKRAPRTPKREFITIIE